MTGSEIATTPYRHASGNALRHGFFAQGTVLPWEDAREFDDLHASIAAEYAPEGPIERYLVEELASILWRRRRLALAERAANGRALLAAMASHDSDRAATAHRPDVVMSYESAEESVRGSEDEVAEIAELEDVERAARRALDVLDAGEEDAIAAALRELPESWRDEVLRRLARRKSPDDPEVVAEVVDLVVLGPAIHGRRRLEIRPLVREQVLADAATLALEGPHARFEAHLDRKFLRVLATLHRLQSLRREAPPPTS
jgi:hypothetical protein